MNKQINPSTCLIKPPIFKEIFFSGSPPEDYFPLRWISYGHNPPHLKKFFWGGSKICRQASCFACGDAELQHLRDLQPIVFNRESMQGHGPIIAEPCLPYFGGGGGGGPLPIKQVLGLRNKYKYVYIYIPYGSLQRSFPASGRFIGPLHLRGCRPARCAVDN